MLVAGKRKTSNSAKYSVRVDVPDINYAKNTTADASREDQMIGFLRETFLLARHAHHLDSFAQSLFLGCPLSWNMIGIVIRKTTRDNTLEIIQQIGTEDLNLIENYKISRSSMVPSVESIRFCVGIFFENKKALAAYSAETQDLSTANPTLVAMAVLPIMVDNENWGAIEFFFSCECNFDSGIQEFFSTLALIIGMVVERCNPDVRETKERSNSGLQESGQSKFPQLNEKLNKIAIMICRGDTNAEIARKLGYSESAIRYETVKLYAMLRVKNRAEASSMIRLMNSG
jgi:DNA-binding CsgD family transcriptional regulator